MNVGGARAIKRKRERDKSRSAPSYVKRRPAAPALIYSRLACLLIGYVAIVVVVLLLLLLNVDTDKWITRLKTRIYTTAFVYFDTQATRAITV